MDNYCKSALAASFRFRTYMSMTLALVTSNLYSRYTHLTFNTAIKFRIYSRDANCRVIFGCTNKYTIREFSSKHLILLHFWYFFYLMSTLISKFIFKIVKLFYYNIFKIIILMKYVLQQKNSFKYIQLSSFFCYSFRDDSFFSCKFDVLNFPRNRARRW